MRTEQCVVVVFLKLESILRSMFFFVDDAFVDNHLRIEQAQGALEEEQCEMVDKGRHC